MEKSDTGIQSCATRIRDLHPAEAVRQSLRAIQQTEPHLHAFPWVLPADAIPTVEGGALAGVPFAADDRICTSFAPTTAASKMLAACTPPYTATAVQRLQAAGAVCVGKLNMDEFSMGHTTASSSFGQTANPWDCTRVPGGSAAAAAVVSGMVPAALASDTSGALRQSCALCGASGIRPTYGAVSRHGLVATAPSMDQIGVVARSIEDCALLLSHVAGHDPHDPTSARGETVDDTAALQTGGLSGLRIGIPAAAFGGDLDSETGDRIMQSARVWEAQGATLHDCALPGLEHAAAACYAIACVEANSSLARYDGIRYGYRAPEASSLHELYTRSRSHGFGAAVKRRLLLGALLLTDAYRSRYYQQALQVRQNIRQAFAQAFSHCDLLLLPCAPGTAPRAGGEEDPAATHRAERYTAPVSLAGLPAAALPCGFAKNGMPIGMQLVGKPFGERALIRAAHAFQTQTDFHRQRPEIEGRTQA